jgi:AraC-like DNA-binding protein
MGERTLPTDADPLGEALHYLRMSGTLYCRSEFTAPWGLDLPALADCLMFHIVTAGECWLEVSGADPCRLQTGSFALVPHGRGHRLASEPGAPAIGVFEAPTERVSDRYEILRHGGGGRPATLICGAVRFDHPAAADLVRLLPPVITVDAWRDPEMEWVQTTLRFMAAEARELRAGGDGHHAPGRHPGDSGGPIVAGHGPGCSDWMAGRAARSTDRARDSACSSRPGHPWTVASMAREATCRARRSPRFSALVGEPAMRWVARWRMNVACARLKDDRITIAALADELGASQAALPGPSSALRAAGPARRVRR